MKLTAHTFSDVTPLCAQYYHRYQTVESPNPPLIIENALSSETIINTYTTQILAFYQHAENEINFFIKLRTSYIKVYSEMYKLVLIDKM